jgi:hypothetical protein
MLMTIALVIDAATVVLDPGSDRVLRGRRDGDRDHEAVVVAAFLDIAEEQRSVLIVRTN